MCDCLTIHSDLEQGDRRWAARCDVFGGAIGGAVVNAVVNLARNGASGALIARAGNGVIAHERP